MVDSFWIGDSVKKDKTNHIKKPAEVLVWTIVKMDDITDTSDDQIISMAEMQNNFKVSRGS